MCPSVAIFYKMGDKKLPKFVILDWIIIPWKCNEKHIGNKIALLLRNLRQFSKIQLKGVGNTGIAVQEIFSEKAGELHP